MEMGLGMWIGIIVAIIGAVTGIYFISKGREKSPGNVKAEDDSGRVLRQLLGRGGLIIDVLKEGSGTEVKKGQTVEVHYTGRLEDGVQFDSSVKRGVPFKFGVGNGQVIQGWEEGVLGMKKGEKRKLTVPPGMAYGSKGAGGRIPPHATLIFHIELIKIG